MGILVGGAFWGKPERGANTFIGDPASRNSAAIHCSSRALHKYPTFRTKAIHYHGKLLHGSVAVCGPGYEHWLFTKPAEVVGPWAPEARPSSVWKAAAVLVGLAVLYTLALFPGLGYHRGEYYCVRQHHPARGARPHERQGRR
jgi:hypothetical protein